LKKHYNFSKGTHVKAIEEFPQHINVGLWFWMTQNIDRLIELAEVLSFYRDLSSDAMEIEDEEEEESEEQNKGGEEDQIQPEGQQIQFQGQESPKEGQHFDLI